jgi:hypothetical protein
MVKLGGVAAKMVKDATLPKQSQAIMLNDFTA